MFQAREPQESLWQSEFLITPRKAKLMRRSWAEVFRNEDAHGLQSACIVPAEPVEVDPPLVPARLMREVSPWRHDE